MKKCLIITQDVSVKLCVSVLCSSVAYHSVLSCMDDLEESRSLKLKHLLSEYFEKRQDRNQTLAPVDTEELDKYRVNYIT